MTAFQDTMTHPDGEIGLETGNVPARDHQEEAADIAVETDLAETTGTIHVSVRDPVEASRLSQDVEQLVTIAGNATCPARSM